MEGWMDYGWTIITDGLMTEIDIDVWQNYEAPLVPIRRPYYTLSPSYVVGESLPCNFTHRIFIDESSRPSITHLTFMG